MRVLAHRVLYRDDHFHAAFPSIVRFSDAHLLLAFRRARNGLWLVPEARRGELDPVNRMDHIDSRSQIMLMELDATGEHPIGDLDMLPVDPEAADQDASLLLLADDRVFLASFSWYPLPSDVTSVLVGRAPPGEEHPGCRYVFWGSHSALRDRTPGHWRAHHRYLQPDAGYGRELGPDGARLLVGPVRGRPARRNGEILLPIYGKAGEGCALFASADQGDSWRYRALIARDDTHAVTYQEPALCDDGRGGLVCFMRTARADGRLATCHSADGLSWGEPRLHALVGHPFHPLPLADGRVLLSYGYRSAPYGIRARVLHDPLADPDVAEEIVIRADGLGPDLGYPWAVQLQDGRVLIAYYWTDAQGVRQIEGSWLELGA